MTSTRGNDASGGNNAGGARQIGNSDFVVVANRLPVDMERLPDGTIEWKRSPGGLVTALEPLRDGNWLLSVRFPDEIARYVVFKGSIAIDGISLTISRVDAGVLSAAVIPHTYANTNLRARRVGDRVNLEADILAKYVERMLSAYAPSGLTEQKLRDLGY